MIGNQHLWSCLHALRAVLKLLNKEMLYLSCAALQNNAVVLNCDEDLVCLGSLRDTSYAVASTGTQAISVSAHAASEPKFKAV